jgi:hypothetical protein
MPYPLEITKSTEEKMAASLSKIMAQVPDEKKPLIRDDYNSHSTALWHPVI